MSDENKLEVVDQKDVDFYGDTLIAIKAGNGKVYVSIRQMCDALGVDHRTQRRNIQNHAILAEGYKRGGVITPPSSEGRGGGRQLTGVLRVDLVPLWLAGIELNRVSEDIRPKLERYQREVAQVLWEAFQQGRLTGDQSLDELLKEDTPAVRAYKMALAIVDLARMQVLMEAKVEDHERRLEAIEATLGDPGRAVTEGQASQISQAVKAVAHAMGGQSKHYQGVYGEMYRKFEIASYRMLPSGRFQEAMDWLAEWYQTLADGDVPF